MRPGGPSLCLRLVLLLFCCRGPDPVRAQQRHPLPVLWMMPLRHNHSAGVRAAVRLALQDLDRLQDLDQLQDQQDLKNPPPPLRQYQLQLHLLDSQCDPAAALKVLFEALWAGPKYLMLFGGVCPSVTSLLARALPALRLVQVSFVAPPPGPTNGNLFSTAPSDRVLNQAALQLLQRNNWTRVGVITQDTPRLLQVREDLRRQLLEVKVHPVSMETFTEDVCSSLRTLKELDLRIIIAHFEEDSADEVFCCAYQLNLFGPGYQWLVSDGGGGGGWTLGRRPSGCGAAEVLAAADGSLRLQTPTLGAADASGVSGRTPQSFRRADPGRVGAPPDPLHAAAYDGVWLAAAALGRVAEALKRRQKFGADRNVTLSDAQVHRKLQDAVRDTRFRGVTGPVFFRDGERATTVQVTQFQGSRGVLVGEFSSVNQQLQLWNHLLKFKGGRPAPDRTRFRPERRHVTRVQLGLVSSAAAATVVMATSCSAFILLHRKHWLLRSWFQDQLLLLGLVLSSGSVLVWGLDGTLVSDPTVEILCSVGLWSLSLGLSVSSSLLFIRSWTLYFVFVIKQHRAQRTCFLLLSLILMDVFVLTSWQILDPLRRVVLQHHSETDPLDPDVLVVPSSERCSSTNEQLWLSAMFGVRGPLLVLGCFLSWSVRSALPGARLPLATLGLTAFSLGGAAAAALTNHSPALRFCLGGAFILGGNTWILLGLVGPTLVQVWRTRGEAPPPSEPGGGANEGEEEEELRRRHTRLLNRTTQLDAEIETLSRKLAESSGSEPLHQVSGHGEVRLVPRPTGEVRSVSWNDRALVCEAQPSPDDVNAPELVRRRVSVQLPILHHAYLPAVGGVSGGVASSSSSLFGSREAFVHLDATVTSSDPPGGSHLDGWRR